LGHVRVTVSDRNGWWQLLSEKAIANRFLHHVGVLTAGNAVSAALALIQGVLIARWLGPELFGVAALVLSFPSVVHTVFDARSSEASVKYLSEFHAKGERDRAVAICWLGYTIDLAVATVAFACIVMLAPWASQAVIRRPETAWLMVVYGAAFLPRALVGTSYAVLVSLGAFSRVAFLNATETLLRAALVLGLTVAGFEVTGVICGNAVAMAAAGAVYIVPALRLIRRTWGPLPWVQTWRTLKGRRREITQFLAYNDLNAFLGMIPKQLDLVLLGYLRSPAEVGYYKLAKSLFGAVGGLVGPLQSVTYPELARRWADGGWQSVRRHVGTLAVHIGIILGLCAASGAVLVPYLIPALVGQAYAPAIPAIRWLLIGAAIWLAFFWLRPVYVAVTELREWSVGIGIYGCVFVMLCLLTVPRWGLEGAAVSQLIVVAGFHILMTLLMTRYGSRRNSKRAL